MRESDSELMTNLFILLRKRLLSFQARIFLNIKNLRQTNATWIVKQPICFLLLMPESKYSYSKMQQPLVLTFYSTRSPEILSWKKLSSESSRVKFKNGIHSTRLSFHCFVSSKFQVLVWRTLSIRWSSVPERPQFCIFEVPKDLNGQNITYLYQLASQIYKIVSDLKYRLIDTP